MYSFQSLRLLSAAGLVSLSIAGIVQPVQIQAQELPASQVKPIDPEAPNVLRPSAPGASLLTIQGGQRLMQEASAASSAQNYALAVTKLQEARQVFNQLSNFYQELASSFNVIDFRVADSQRKKALEAAQLRDEATYQLALAHRAQNQADLAFPLLVQVIRSQQPTRELGKKAYQQLTEIEASLLSLDGGKQLMQEASTAVAAQNYSLATKKLQEARQVFNQVSNLSQETASSFTAIDNQVADTQRKRALEAAQLRDESTYQLALVHRAQNQPDLAVPLLVQIVRSQQPSRDLGKKAYQQLFELGFVDAPYPRRSGATSSAN
jgi:tetratricopeptide (TPR) repeat protein